MGKKICKRRSADSAVHENLGSDGTIASMIPQETLDSLNYDCNSFVIYVDGSMKSIDDYKYGGTGAVIRSKRGELIKECGWHYSGDHLDTNDMELLAVLDALSEVKSDNIVIFTDSDYVVNTINHWINTYKSYRWRFFPEYLKWVKKIKKWWLGRKVYPFIKKILGPNQPANLKLIRQLSDTLDNRPSVNFRLILAGEYFSGHKQAHNIAKQYSRLAIDLLKRPVIP